MRPGDLICDEYTLVRLLGRGAFGEVWQATQDRLRRDVALKFATPSLLEGVVGGPERFAQEAITHGQLDHRHIVPLYDARNHEGLPFLVMSYLRGGTLADKAGRLPVAELVRHGVAVCDALAYAHKRLVVHRDIKPLNLLLDDDGEVRVADFGIARLLDTVKRNSGGRATVAGTEGFAAPEQLRGDTVDVRADVFGLGATLVFLVTGRSPIDLILRQREKLLDRVGAVDLRLRAVLDRMTQEEPEDRYATALEARAALLSVVSTAVAPAAVGVAPALPTGRTAGERRSAAVASTQTAAAPVVDAAPVSADRAPQASSWFWVAGLAALSTSVALVLVRMGVAGTGVSTGAKPALAESTPAPIVSSAPHATKAPPADPPAPAGAPVAPPAAGLKWTGASGYEMVWVSPGTFDMGSPASETSRYRDEAQHRVTLTHGYWAGRTEVTQGQWLSVMGSTPSVFRGCGADCPVEQVSWCDAVSFANALSRADGLRAAYSGVDACALNRGAVEWDRAADGYRLPTEAEWEMAARGGGRPGVYAGGELDAVAWHRGNSATTTRRVCTKQANSLGLCDASGNVYEWVWDWYGEYPVGAVTDPAGPGSGSSRVVRGGSWRDYPQYMRVADRSNLTAVRRGSDVGFRLVRSSLAP